MSAKAFERKTAIWIAAICTISFLGLGALTIFGPDFSPTRSGDADVYSPTAVGHAALYDLLGELDVPRAIYRDPKRVPLEGQGLLLALEPELERATSESDTPLLSLVEQSPSTLLALPKWLVRTTPTRPPRTIGFTAHDTELVLGPLWELDIEAELVRVRIPPENAPRQNVYGMAPRFDHPYRQLLRSDALEPLIEYPEGILLGATEVAGRRVFVLSDPDLLQNHGLHRGDNARLIVTVIEELRASGPAVFAETLHGFPAVERSLVRELFDFPLVLLLLHAVLTLALLLWAGLGRFGDAPPPERELEAGSDFLIRHTAHLLRFGRHRDMALAKYLEGIRRTLSDRYRLPRGLTKQQIDERLDALGERMETTQRWSQLVQRARTVASRGAGRSEAEVLSVARALHNWKQEILDGTRSNPRDEESAA